MGRRIGLIGEVQSRHGMASNLPVTSSRLIPDKRMDSINKDQPEDELQICGQEAIKQIKETVKAQSWRTLVPPADRAQRAR